MAVSPTRKPPYHKDHLSPRCKYSEYNSDDNDDDDDEDDDDDDDDDDSDDDDGDARACRPRLLFRRLAPTSRFGTGIRAPSVAPGRRRKPIPWGSFGYFF